MGADPRLEELRLRWQEGRDNGERISAEELCEDCPELLEELRRQIQVIEKMEAKFGLDEDETLDVDPGTPSPPAFVVPGHDILEELGRGAFGVVYKARQVSLGRTVALKMLLPGSGGDALSLARFRIEAEAVARMQHPHIVQIHEVGDCQGQPYFSLEYLEGGTLKQRLEGRPLPDEQAAELLEVLARAVHHAHERGIIHRDLKPANILLTAEGLPKVADFGLAKFLLTERGQTQTDVVMGTVSYMSPEQAEGKSRDVGPSADVYALGAILYEMLTGQPPFRGATLFDVLVQVREEPPRPPRGHNPRVGPALEAICLKCLQKDPAERYPSAQALANDLQEYLGGGDPVQAERGVAPRLMRAVLRRSRYTEVMTRWARVWMAIAALYFVVCLTKSVMLWQDLDKRHDLFLALWVFCFLAVMLIAWLGRVRGGPPLSHVERQLGQIWGFFWGGFFLTAWIYQRTQGSDSSVAGLLPILVLEAAIVFGCMATILGGSFYVMAAACAATAILEALVPRAGPLISAVVASPALFWLGWQYARLSRIAED